MAEQKIKYSYVMVPCSQYNVAGTENWLEDMASKGYVLSKDGFFMGFGIFQKVQPQRLRYRLQAARKSKDAQDNQPGNEEMEIYSRSGWEFVTRRKSFNIYCTADPDAVEVNTDPYVQALALDVVRKQERGNLISSVLWLMVYPFGILMGQIATSLLVSNIMWLIGILLLTIVIGNISTVVRLNKMRKCLMEGTVPEYRGNLRKTRWLYRGSVIVFWLFAVFVAVNVLAYCNSRDSNDLPLQGYMQEHELPFATMEDFAQGEFYFKDIGSEFNTIETGASIMADEIIDLRQYGTIVSDEGTAVIGGLVINYIHSKSEFFARRAAREMTFTISRRGGSWFGSKNEEISLPELNVDYAAAYNDIFPTVILQKGKQIVKAYYYSFSDDNYYIPLEQWVEAIAQSLQG